jgi:hypothetical protein
VGLFEEQFLAGYLGDSLATGSLKKQGKFKEIV